MARQYFINGETLVTVTSPIVGSAQELGLADSPITVTIVEQHDEIKVDAWGASIPEEQFMGAYATIDMSLVHYDVSVMDNCMRESMGGAGAVGQIGRAGALQGGQATLQTSGNHYINLRLTSPVGSKPWTFPAARLLGSWTLPMGVERTVIRAKWRAVPYTTDPYQSGSGSSNATLWTYS